MQDVLKALIADKGRIECLHAICGGRHCDQLLREPVLHLKGFKCETHLMVKQIRTERTLVAKIASMNKSIKCLLIHPNEK